MNEITIISNAIEALGQKYEAESKLVRLASNLYPGVRDRILKAKESPCSIKTEFLDDYTHSDIAGFDYKFEAPADLLSLVSSDNEHFLEGMHIYSNSKSINIKYVFQNSKVDTFDKTLIEAIENELTALIARYEKL